MSQTKCVVIALFLIVNSAYANWCSSNSDCVGILNAECSENRCECRNGYFLDQASNECIELAPYAHSRCTQDIQCQRLFVGYRCDNTTNMCVCNEGFRYMLGRCWPYVKYGEACTNKYQCYDRLLPYALDCIGGVCDCAEGYYARQKGYCRRIAKRINDTCVLDSDCQIQGVANAKCVGMICTDGDSLALNPTQNINSEEIKIAPTALEGGVCATDADCSSLGAAECSRQRHCICKPGYYSNSARNLCLSDLGQVVTDTRQCASAMGTIVDNVCDCPNGFFYDEYLRECIKPSRTFRDSCANNDSCYTFGAGGICVQLPDSFFQVCDCDTSFSIKDEANLICSVTSKLVGENCAEGDICPINSECINNICDCVNGTEPGPGNTICLKYNLELGEECNLDEQCGTSSSNCKEGVCTCLDTHYPEQGICQIGLGAPCENIMDCNLPNSFCDISEDESAGICACRNDFIQQDHRCLRKSTTLNDECVLPIQCWENLGGEDAVSCVDNRCICNDNYHVFNDTCFQSRGLDESCTRSVDCYLPGGYSERLECRRGTCACQRNYIRQYSPDFCNGAASLAANSIVISAIIAVLINHFR